MEWRHSWGIILLLIYLILSDAGERCKQLAAWSMNQTLQCSFEVNLLMYLGNQQGFQNAWSDTLSKTIHVSIQLDILSQTTWNNVKQKTKTKKKKHFLQVFSLWNWMLSIIQVSTDNKIVIKSGHLDLLLLVMVIYDLRLKIKLNQAQKSLWRHTVLFCDEQLNFKGELHPWPKSSM